MRLYVQEPTLSDGALTWRDGPARSPERQDPAPRIDPFQSTGGLKQLSGNLGTGHDEGLGRGAERHVIEARCRIFHEQEDVKTAFKAGEFTADTVSWSASRARNPTGCPSCTG